MRNYNLLIDIITAIVIVASRIHIVNLIEPLSFEFLLHYEAVYSPLNLKHHKHNVRCEKKL